jgi:excisionase family DNA binding protein
VDSPPQKGGDSHGEGDGGPAEPGGFEEWLTKDAAARYLSMSTKSIQRYVAQGDLPAYRAGRSLRIRRSDLDDFLTRPKAGDPEASVAVEVPSKLTAVGQGDGTRPRLSERDLLELGRQAHSAGLRQIFKNRVADASYKAAFDKALHGVETGTVKIMSNSLRFLLGPQPDMSLYIPMWDALKRGVKFQLLLLNPFSDAARTRAGIEEREDFAHKEARYQQTHLYRDIIAVAQTLAEPDVDFIRDATLRERLKNRDQVDVRFSSADPTTHLVLTDELCLVENYHTGGDDEIQRSLEHMGIPDVHCFGGFITAFLYARSALTGRLLATHFEHSWQQAGSRPTLEEVIAQHEQQRKKHG